MRTILEKLSRQVILKRKLPKQFGSIPVYVSPDSALKFWFSNFEKRDPILLKMCRELVKPSDVVWDVGANVGMFSFAAAVLSGLTGRVLAIEPDIFLSNLMLKSISKQNQRGKIMSRVDVLPVAVSDESGIAEFNIAARGRSTNFLANTAGAVEAGGVREKISVMSVTLDWLLDHYPAPNVVKIDVETAEDLVLKGSIRLLKEIRPVIFCEVSPDNKKKIDTVANILKQNNYSFYNAEMDHCNRTKLEIPAFNTLAIPN